MKTLLNIAKNTALPYFIISITMLVLFFIVRPFVEIGLDDSWRYAFPVKSLIDSGEMRLSATIAPNLFLQLAWGYLFCIPFGFSFLALRISVFVLSVGCLMALYKLLALATANRPLSLVAVFLLMFNMLFFSLSFNYMTDVPFLLLALMAVYYYHKFLRSQQLTDFVYAASLSMLAFLIRQPGIILPFVFAFFDIMGSKTSRKKAFFRNIITLSVALAIYTVTGLVRKSIANYVAVDAMYFSILAENPISFTVELLKKYIKTIIFIGIFLLPLWTFAFHHFKNKIKSRTWIHVLIWSGNVLLFVMMYRADKIFPFGGNTIYNAGLGPFLLNDVYIRLLPNVPQLPLWVCVAITYIGQISGSYIVWWLLAIVVRKLNMFALFLLATATIYLTLMSVTSFYDRYVLLPFVFVAIVLFVDLAQIQLDKHKIRRISFGIAIFAWIVVTATHDRFAWNRARLEAFSYLSENNIPISQIDAGCEINGWLNYNEAEKYKPDIPNKSNWWVDDDQFIISAGDIEGYTTIRKFKYRRWLHFKSDYIHIVERGNNN